MDGENFPWIRSTVETLWQGVVKVDNSILNCVSCLLDQKDELKLYEIVDTTYPFQDNIQLDNIHNQNTFPNRVTIIIRGKFLEFMNCLAFTSYVNIETKKFLKKYNVRKIMMKGFILEPIISKSLSKSQACLATTQFDNKDDKMLNIEQLGHLTFTSGSQTSHMNMRKSNRSVTPIFISSDEKPFVARFGPKHKLEKLTCNNTGLYRDDDLKQNKKLLVSNSSTSNNEDYLEILKIRLSKGEITIDEYHKLNKIMEGNAKTAFYW